MKVLLLLTQDRGGPVDLTMALATELATRANSLEITVAGPITVSSTGQPWNLLRQAHVRSKADLRGFAAVSRLLERLAPDIVHAQDRRAALVASFVAGSRTPVVMTFHGVPDSAAGRWVQAGPLQGRRPGMSCGSRLVADALVARRVTCTVAPSAAMGEFPHHELRVPAHRLRVVPNGVAIPPYRRPVKPIRTFVTVGSFAPCKATPVLIEAFVAVAASRPGLRLRMIGDGDDRRRCEELAGRAGPGRIEFMGYRTDVDAQLKWADAFVLPSLNENLPLALLQAMATGLPCIATNVGGIPEALGGDCGVLVPPGDVRSLGAAMERLIDQPSLAARLGAAARSRVAEAFSLSRCADDHLQLWSDILGSRSQ